MARLLGFLLLLVLVLLGLSFAVLNAQPVALNYYFGYRQIPLSMIVVLSLVAGAAIGALVSVGAIVKLKHRAKRLQKQLSSARKEADQLRVLPAKE